MPYKFILEGILLKVIVMENDSSKRKGYGANLAEKKEKNDLHYAIGFADINKSGILSGYIYTNVNESRHNLYFKLISAIHNFCNNNSAEDHNNKTSLVISYNLYGNRKPFNDWDNLDFFLITFFILFLYKDGGHITP